MCLTRLLWCWCQKVQPKMKTINPSLNEVVTILSWSLTECYKTVNALIGTKTHEFFNFANKYRPLRSNHGFKLKTNTCSIKLLQTFFFIRIVNSWNNLRKETAEARDLKSSKTKLFREFSWYNFIVIIILCFVLYKYILKLYIVFKNVDKYFNRFTYLRL